MLWSTGHSALSDCIGIAYDLSTTQHACSCPLAVCLSMTMCLDHSFNTGV